MYCGKCGKEINEENKFCPYCGYLIIVHKKDIAVSNRKKRGWIGVLFLIVILIAAIFLWKKTTGAVTVKQKYGQPFHSEVQKLEDMYEDISEENVLETSETEMSVAEETESLGNAESAAAAIKMYAELLENSDYMTEMINQYLQMVRPSAYDRTADSYTIADLDADGIPELLLFDNMTYVYIIDCQKRISCILGDTIYNKLNENLFYCTYSPGSSMEVVAIGYNMEMTGEADGLAIFSQETVLKADWNGYYEYQLENALQDGEGNNLTEEDFLALRTQYLSNCETVSGISLNDRSVLKEWQKKTEEE